MRNGIVLWCGSAPNQRALACKVHERFGLAGIVVERRKPPRRTMRSLISKASAKVLFGKIGDAWKEMQNFYESRYPSLPQVPLLEVEDINSEGVARFTQQLAPSVIMVSGTRMVKGGSLEMSARVPMLNLHTGLSPYVKGGPNCTNWCLANDAFHLIGNTVMWIDGGVDSGDILTTDFAHFDGGEDLVAIHIKVMEQAHALYLKAVETLLKNPAAAPRVAQEGIGNGKTYYTKMWGVRQMAALLRNIRGGRFSETVRSPEFISRRDSVKTVTLP